MKRGHLRNSLLLIFPKLRLFIALVDNFPKIPTMRLPIKILIGSGSIFFFIIIFGWIAFPKLLKSKIKGQLAVKPGSEMRGMYVKVPFPLDFKVYLFNVTNVNEVQNGDTPVLDEIGPYFYEEWKEKVDEVDHEDEDTLEFRMKDTFIFKPEKTAPLTGDEIVNIPHPFIVGLVNAVARTKPAMISLANKAINAIFRNPSNIFLTARVKDILFEGVTIDCSVTDFAGKAVCTELKAAKEIEEVEKNILKFSLLGSKNATAGKIYKVFRGVKNIHDLGRVVEYDHEKEMKVWPTKECNQYHGTDGTIFPPFLKDEEGLVSFSPDLCRSLKAEFVEKTSFRTVPVNHYYATLGDMSKNPDEKCYCPTPTTCLKRGVLDLMKCINAPFVASLPHFYEADESYLHGVRGLHPNNEDHGIHIYFESMTGSPVAAKKRLQFNMPFERFDKVPLLKNIPEALVPMFWIEEGVELNSTYTSQLKSAFTMIKIVKISKWVILVSSLCGMGAAAYLYFKKNGEVDITPVQTVQASNGHTDPPKSAIISMLNGNNLKGGGDQHNSISLGGKEFEKY